MKNTKEADVFSLICPMNDSQGKDDWFDAIEEYLHCDLDIKLSTEREHENYPNSTLMTWSKDLINGSLWKTWITMVAENGLDLKLSGKDLMPLATLFSEIGIQTIKDAKESTDQA